MATAVINICLAPELAQQMEKTMRSMRWNVSVSNFDAYISAERRPSISPQMRSADLRLCFVDFDWNPEQAAESTRHLKQLFHGNVNIIAIGRSRDADLLLKAMRAGCSEFLEKPVSEDTILETMYRMEHAVTPAEEHEPTDGTVCSLFGVKGGVGTTTAAVHLAMYLTQCHKKKTLLIDNHAELGHVCVYLGMDGSHFNFNEVVRNVSRLDSELLKGYIAKHSSGLDVLSSPDVCGVTRSNDPDSIAQTLEFLRGEYDFIIIDSSMGLDPGNVAVVQASAQVFLVATPEIGPLRDLTRYLDAFAQVDDAGEKIRVVLNRFSSPSAVSLPQIESAIKTRVTVKLPNCYQELVRTENLGQPIAPGSKSEFGSQILRWSESLSGAAVSAGGAESKSKKPLFGSWK